METIADTWKEPLMLRASKLEKNEAFYNWNGKPGANAR